eukprot:TRINITY_DN11698_c0_g1_i3.p1 TRINITY_DN11698_c0_g1~~TRINITY_DN11698_c0_g1_i3.p1  ORF type:complete len:169 (-),score=35.38 TRINITY_DN11698_c0_g1_i3:73-519(-)
MQPTAATQKAQDVLIEKQRKELKEETEKIIKTLNDCIAIVEDFKEDSCEHFLRKINEELMGSFQSLQDKRDCDIEIPIEVLDYIDQGSNPELYTLGLRDKSLRINEAASGKMRALKDFQSSLETEIASVFPEEWLLYKAQMENRSENV